MNVDLWIIYITKVIFSLVKLLVCVFKKVKCKYGIRYYLYANDAQNIDHVILYLSNRTA